MVSEIFPNRRKTKDRKTCFNFLCELTQIIVVLKELNAEIYTLNLLKIDLIDINSFPTFRRIQLLIDFYQRTSASSFMLVFL